MIRTPTVERCIAVTALAVLMSAPAFAQSVPTLLFEDASVQDVANALYERCYDAGMAVESSDAGMIACSASLDGAEPLPADIAIADVHEGHVRHLIRFSLADRAEGVRVWAHPWIETSEADGIVLEDEIRSSAYLARVQTVLGQIGEALASGAGAAPREPWADHYESEDAWRLDAHLRAVEYCDRRSGDLTVEQIERRLELAEVQPLSRSLRGRCEELYEPVFGWGLARGVADPTVEGYADYRASLPDDERCAGQLALEATCR